VFGSARVCSDTLISSNAYISSSFDYFYINGICREGKGATFYKCKDNIVYVICGYFYGTLEEFEKWTKETHGDNKYGKGYLKLIELAKLQFDIE